MAKCKLIRPAYMPIAEVVDYENKKFIVLWCPGGDSRPYSAPKTMAKDNKERIHYIRKMSNTVEPSDDEERSYFISRFYIHKEFQNVLKKEPKRS